MSYSKQKDTKSSAEWHFWALTGQPNFHKNAVLNFVVFFYYGDSVRSPDAKRTQR